MLSLFGYIQNVMSLLKIPIDRKSLESLYSFFYNTSGSKTSKMSSRHSQPLPRGLQVLNDQREGDVGGKVDGYFLEPSRDGSDGCREWFLSFVYFLGEGNCEGVCSNRSHSSRHNEDPDTTKIGNGSEDLGLNTKETGWKIMEVLTQKIGLVT